MLYEVITHHESVNRYAAVQSHRQHDKRSEPSEVRMPLRHPKAKRDENACHRLSAWRAKRLRNADESLKLSADGLSGTLQTLASMRNNFV